MTKVANGFTPVLTVDRHQAKPLHRQIYDAYRTRIASRHLHPGQRIPSTRSLASELGISRIPVLSAYAQLLAEGYFESRSGSGTFVSKSVPEPSGFSSRQTASRATRSGPRLNSHRSDRLPRFRLPQWLANWGAFSVGKPAFEHFPFRIWANLIARHSRNVRVSALRPSDPMGAEEFRASIASYLRTVRGVNCTPDQIMIVNGSQQALEIAANVLLDPGDPVWVEEPGYHLGRQVFALAGCRMIPVPVDQEGMKVEAGIERCRTARAAFVTPSHQFPLGVTMSASRRLQLLDWAHRYGSWIIEDDYDSEYRYEGMPISCLQGLDTNDRVIYIGTFSKALFPSLRMGYIVIPSDLVERFVAVRHAMDLYPAHLYQEVLKDFIDEGHFSCHIRRSRMIYAGRRNALVEAIREELGPESELMGTEAGVHLVLMLRKGSQDREISELAARDELWLCPLSALYLGKNSRPGFILGFGSTVAEDIPGRVRQLRGLLGSGVAALNGKQALAV